MRKTKDFPFWYDKTLRFLAIRPRSRQEMSDYLLRKKAGSELSRLVVTALTEARLIDDTEFARWFIENRKTFRPKGKRALRYELAQKGIEREIIEHVLDTDLDDVEEESAARRVVAKKLRLWRHLSHKDIRSNVHAMLARRGFNWSVIERVLKNVDSENEHLTYVQKPARIGSER